MVECVMSGLTAVTDHPLSGNTIKSPCPRYSYLSRSPRTVTGDGERPLSAHRFSQDLSERRVSAWTPISSFEGVDAQKIDQTQWRDYEMPKELEMVQAGTPLEIRRIITASLDKHRSPLVDPTDPDISQNLHDWNVTQSVRLQLDTEPNMANRSHGRSTRATSGASDTSLTSYGTDSEGTLARSSVSSVSSTSLKPESNPQIVPAQRTPGLPKVTMGPLGWIMTYEEEEKPQSWWRRRKGPKKPKPTIAYDQVVAHDKVIPREPSNEGECASCLEEMSNNKLVALACQHKYCASCFSQLVGIALQNENLFPPRCCLQEVPAKLINSNVRLDLKTVYKQKAKEFAVPAGDRWYCPSTRCAKWIDPGRLLLSAGSFKCPHCRVRICPTCRAAEHADHEDCPQDFGLEATLEEAERAGWRRCYNCRAMVELIVGCRHITCKCRAEFCYTCGAIWKTCHCTEIDQVQRRQRIREQAQVQDEAARAEEAEIAAAIRAVEEAQRREAEEGERQERVRQEAETQRLAEEAEAARLEEEERVTAISQRFVDLQAILEALHCSQQKSLCRRHETEVKKAKENLIASQLAFDAKWALEKSMMNETNQDSMQQLNAEHQTALQDMDTRHEEEEDELFLALQVHLRNKSNRDARQAAMIEKIKKAQLEEREDFTGRLRLAMEETRRRQVKETEDLEASLLQERDSTVEIESRKAETVARTLFADRMWFNTLVDERRRMLEADERRLMQTGGNIDTYSNSDTESQAQDT